MAGEAILGNIVTEIWKKLGSLALEEINLAKGVKKEVEKLKTTIGLIEAVIGDAENKQVKEKAVGIWLNQLKDLAYEADDILDEYAYDLMHQRQGFQVRNFFKKGSNPIARSLKRGHEIKDLNQKFDELASLRVKLGLKILGVGSSSGVDHGINHPETYASVVESEVLGRGDDKSNIINRLLANKSSSCNQTDKISVIPIVGMGGLGKTTLAQLVYNDNVVKKHFDLRIWVCVSDDFDVKKIFIRIIESLPGKKIDAESNLNIIVNILQQRLVGKKFLLVLDDIWNERDDEWNRLKDPLVVGAEGSKILVTTRSENVASIVLTGEFPSYKLQTLEDDICLSIFEQRAFGPSCKAVKTPTLVDIGKELVRKSGGLPLVAKALGNLMHSKKEVGEWEVIRYSKIWDNNPENPNKILPALKLSYDHLLPQVKVCFSYCSMFPKDSVINRKTLIRLWVAEGFIQPFGGDERLMEEIGNEYFCNLLWNSFFQGVSTNKDGEITKFKMHDLIHDLAHRVIGTHECSITEASKMGDISEFRRLNLLNVNEESSSSAIATVVSKSKLRTLFIKGGRIANYDSLLNNNKRLRVLDLRFSDIEELPASIGDLKHLRYLDLSNCRNLKKLPDSITRLYNLQTLLLKGCPHLEKFPKDLNKLINLRHLLHGVSDWQLKVGQLTCLQTLSRFGVPEDNGGSGVGGGIGELQFLNLLRGRLVITGLERVRGREKAEKANLKAKEYIKELNLDWRGGPGVEVREDEDEYNNHSLVLEGLQPHPNLRSLEIINFMGPKFPTWMSSSNLQNLVHLGLVDCKRCKQLPALGVLPSLRFLEISNMALLEEWQLDQPLPLSIVSSSSYSYPSLESIEISECPKLKSMPTEFFSLKEFNVRGTSNGMGVSSLVRSNLDTLTKLVIEEVDGLEFLPLVGLLKGNNVLQDLYVCECPDFKGFNREEEEEGDDDLSVLSSSSISNISSLRGLYLFNCSVLRLLPDLKDLTSLEDVTIQGCNEDLVISLPNGVENRIFKFVTLEKFKAPSNTIEGISESEGLTSGEGQVENLERVKDGKKAVKENLKQTQNIKRVALTWKDETMLDEDHDSNNDSLVLEGLRPHPSLRSLIITCFMVPTFPKWMGDPLCLPNLVELELHSCNRCEQLPALGKLPFLRLLILRGMIAIKRLGREFYYGGGEGSILLSEEAATNTAIAFPSLNELVLDDMPNLEEWVESLQPKVPFSTSASSSTSTSSFPLLESIEIKLCPKLKSIPTLFPSLSNLEFYSSNGTSLSSVMKSNLGSLVSLYIEEVPRLFFLPQGLLTNNNVLQSLDIYDCPDFEGFIDQGEEIELFNSNISSLQFLTILDCPILTFLPVIRGMTSLQRLTILDCNKELNILPEDLECLSSLEEFEFGSSHPNEIEEAKE